MIFSTWQFACFFVVVFTLYWSLRTRRDRHILLLISSYIFYMCWNAKLVTIIMGLTLLDYSVGLGLVATHDERRKRLLLVASLIGNLGILAIFKYADFFILSLRDLLHSAGVHSNLHTLGIILPIGISFHTFQTMSYTIDVYRGRAPVERSLINFALFVAFFPQLVAGPIVKAIDFLPQLRTDKRFDWPRLDSAALLFLIGLTKKLLIADTIATIIDPVFADPTHYTSRDLWLVMFGYGAQIYCDFSGYTDMAIAVARALGFDMPTNFANPYLATSLVDFWRRWHISLSTWLRDYLYIPLGGSRDGRLFTARNLMITMLLGGLWHGASWTFVIWGAIHGIALVITKLFQNRAPIRAATVREGEGSLSRAQGQGPKGNGNAEIASSLYPSSLSPSAFGTRFLCWALTLLTVHIAWVFFRCQPVIPPGGSEPEPTIVALQRAAYFTKHLMIPTQIDTPAWIMNKIPLVALIALMFAMQLFDERTRLGRAPLRLPAPAAGVAYACWIAILIIFAPENVQAFIYFQF